MAGDLGIDEAVDGLGGDDRPVVVPGEAPGALLRRPTALAPGQDCGPQGGIAVQLGALPAAGVGLLVGIAGVIALGVRCITGQFPSNACWRAIQSCRDLAGGSGPRRVSGQWHSVLRG